MDETKLENRLTTLETNQQYMADQLIDVQDMQKDIRDLALSVNSLACSVDRMCKDMCSIDGRLKSIEVKPAERWNDLVKTILTVIAAGLAGYFLNYFLR